MSSVLSPHAASSHCSSDRNDQLTQSPRAGHDSYSPYHIPDSRVTVELIRLLLATIVRLRVCNASHPLVEPWRMTPTCRRRNQGGFYGIL